MVWWLYVAFALILPYKAPAGHGVASNIHAPVLPQFPLSEPGVGLPSMPLFAHPCEHLVGQ